MNNLDFKIEVGKRYELRNGLITEPIEKGNHVNFKFSAWVNEPEYASPSRRDWLENGHFLSRYDESHLDIVKEVI